MKIIDVIQVDEAKNVWDYLGVGQVARDVSTWGLEKLASAIGRGKNSVWRKSEAIVPEIVALEKTNGRELTTAEIEQHIIKNDPLVKTTLDDALKAKQKHIDDMYAADPAGARRYYGTPVPPTTRLTQAEEAYILSKPEYKPDPKLVKDVEKKVENIRSTEKSAAAKAAVQPLKDGIKTLFKYGIPASLAVQILAPFTEYYEKVAQADKYLEAKQIPDDKHPKEIKTVEEWYVWYCDRELGEALVKAGAALALGMIGLGVAKGFFGWALRWVGFAKTAAAIEAGTIVLTSAIIAKVFTEERNADFGALLANFLGVDIKGKVGSFSRAIMPDGLFGQVSRWVLFKSGSCIAWFAEFVRQWVPLFGWETGADDLQKRVQGKPVDKDDVEKPSGQPDTPLAPPGGQTAVPPAPAPTNSGRPTVNVEKGDPSTDQNAQAGFVDLGGGWLKDPATGQIYPKLRESR